MAQETTRTQTDHEMPVSVEPEHGLQGRAFVVAMVMLGISLIWIRQAGIIALGVQVDESVPVIPAVAAVLILAAVGPMLSRLPRRFHFPRHQSLLVYAFLCIAVSMSSVGVVRQLLPQLTVPFYFASPENNYELLQKDIPSWLAPANMPALQQMYEGSPDGAIVWGPWIVPLIVWTIFCLATFISMYSLMLLFRKQWIEKEHLTFPIVRLVMDMADYGEEGRVGAFLRNPLMWTAFMLSLIYNLMNMLQAWNPAVPALGKYWTFGTVFTERPWSAFAGLSIAWRPENFGIGYLVSTEVLLSGWVFYLMVRSANFFAAVGGYEIPGLPFEGELAYGGYLALAIVLFWVGREHVGRVLHKAFTGDPAIDDSDEPFPYKTIVWAGIIGFVVMMAIAVQAGMWLWVAGLYFIIILLFAVTYARLRAEAGSPMVWLFPIMKQWEMMYQIGGSAVLQRGTGWGNLTIFSIFYWLSRGFFPTMAGYQIESSRIAQEARINQRTMVYWLVAALLIGLLGAYVMHLQAYYSYGANVLEGGTTEGGSRVQAAAASWKLVSAWVNAHSAPDRSRLIAGVVGFAFTTLLVVLRSMFLRFPLHPLGFVMITSYGGPVWGPFFIVWIIKSIVLRVGGMKLYRQLIPFFLGLILGHFFMAGVVWGSISLHNEMYNRYGVWFG